MPSIMNSDIQTFKNVCHPQQDLKECVDDYTHTTSFEEGWKILMGQFLYHVNFVNRLVSIFPGASTFAANFSAIGWEKENCQIWRPNFSLEAILYCNQYEDTKHYS